MDSKLPKGLYKFLKKECQGETLAIADSKLGKVISDKLVSVYLCSSFMVLGQGFRVLSVCILYLVRFGGVMPLLSYPAADQNLTVQ